MIMSESIQIRILEDLQPFSTAGQRWEALVKSNTASGIMQSLHWRDMKQCQGLTSFHLAVFRDRHADDTSAYAGQPEPAAQPEPAGPAGNPFSLDTLEIQDTPDIRQAPNWLKI